MDKLAADLRALADSVDPAKVHPHAINWGQIIQIVIAVLGAFGKGLPQA